MIICADPHIRKTIPRARKDDYWTAQELKFRFVLELAQESPPLVIPGDFFDTPRPGPFLEKWVIDLLNEYQIKPVVVPGQHDLPNHSLEAIPDSGIGVLAAAGVIELLLCGPDTAENFWSNDKIIVFGLPYGKEMLGVRFHVNDNRIKILLWHHMVINAEPLWPGQVADKATGLLKKYPNFQLICTGDNHQTFAVASPDGRWLINPGSLMRMTAAQIDHRPCVFRWENGKVEQIFLPTEPDVLDLTELEGAKERDSRISAFVERLSIQHEVGLDFRKNIEEFLRTGILMGTPDSPIFREVRQEVKDLIWRCLE